MASIKASWRQAIHDDSIRRSSQVVAVTKSDLLVFSGEVKPRQPVGNKLHRISLTNGHAQIDTSECDDAPSPRVGSASTTLNGKTYLFSGRGGEAMAPVDEQGVLHVLDTSTLQWSTLRPAEPTSAVPQARSYHAMSTDGHSTLFLHAGCPESGRLSDLWAFDTNARKWTQLADAPGPARGGTSIAYLNGKVYRVNGFDGKTEQGYALDTYDLQTNEWMTKTWDASNGPSPRSVSALLAVRLGGRDKLVTLFGESDPSNLGHQGAGRMLDDVWAYDVVDGTWSKVEVDGKRPQSRGWFAADITPSKDEIVVQGGLSEDNERLGDAWILSF